MKQAPIHLGGYAEVTSDQRTVLITGVYPRGVEVITERGALLFLKNGEFSCPVGLEFCPDSDSVEQEIRDIFDEINVASMDDAADRASGDYDY